MSKDLEFQIIDWNYYHEKDDDDEYAYIIQLLGRTIDDKDVCLRVAGFIPHFYIKIPKHWESKQCDEFAEFLKKKVEWKFKNNENYEFDYDLGKSLIHHTLVNKYDFYGFNGRKKFKFLRLDFKSYIAMREFSGILARPLALFGVSGQIGNDKIKFQRYESNIEPHIRFMHINNISSCGWVQIPAKDLEEIKEYSSCDLSYSTNWKNVKPSAGDQDRMAPFKIMGYDIECISCDHNFCQANRITDEIIQIGFTMYRYGSLKCYEQYILTLGDCDEIEGANVWTYPNEKKLLKGYADIIKKLRPDFKTGYNTSGFDDEYIFDRMRLLDKETARKKKIEVENLSDDDSLMNYFLKTAGKVNNEYLRVELGAYFTDRDAVDSITGETSSMVPVPTKYLTYLKEKNLSSAALGDNILKFFQIPGIISIDMFKIIQRDHKLTGYKLDNVSANFITERAEQITPSTKPKLNPNGMIPIQIFTKSTKALELNSYIQIMVNDGYSPSPLREHAKYQVLKITETTDKNTIFQAIHIEITAEDYDEMVKELANKLHKVFWTFAKDDMHHTLINKYYKEKNIKKVTEVAKYCLKDCKLANLLMAKLEIIVNNVGMAQVCHVPLSYIFIRGQGVKIFSLVSKKCREEGFLIPVLQRKSDDLDDDDVGYEGATVITPKPAVYMEPIGILDFSSLYPNAMREGNLSQETYVDDPAYANLPGYKYRDVPIILKDDKGRIRRNLDGSVMKEFHKFAQKIDEKTHEPIYGILPQILTELLDKRKAINFRLGNDKTLDSFKKNILNSLQLAYKITANSLYGQTGAKTSPLFFLPIAASTTAIGRERLYFARDIVEKNIPGAEVVYGDSVTGDTPILYRDAKRDINICSIRDLGEKWKPYEEFKSEDSNRKFKEQSKADFEVWTADGWAKIKRVIRHKTIKKIYRVLTHTGCIDVTEDHSLLDINKKIIKPTDCKVGTELLHGFMPPRNKYDNVSAKEAFVWGFFMGDGSCGEYDTKWGVKYTWALNNADLKILKKCKRYLEEVEGFKFKILDTMESSHVYKLVPVGSIKYMVRKYRPLFYDPSKYKLVPKEILNSIPATKQIFFDGYFAADGCRADLANIGCRRCDIKGKVSAQSLFYLLQCLGYNVSLNTRADKTDIFRLTYTDKTQRKNTNAIKKLDYMKMTSKVTKAKHLDQDDDDDEYVYDLETESGTFHAGVGKLIVKNTDSIFINFHLTNPETGEPATDKNALIKTIELSKHAAALINAMVPKPQSIVYEKTFWPWILVAKKKYVGLKYEKDPNKCVLTSMGIVLKRRDNAPIVKIVVGGIIDYIFETRDIKKAIDYTKRVITQLMDGYYPIAKFIISKTLKGKYKKPKSIAHKVLADRMAVRDPGNKPQVNDRIPYVYIVKDIGKKKKKDVLQGDLIENPDFVIKNGLKLDYLYYLEHQIINPATRILELMVPTSYVNKMFSKFMIKEWNKRLGRQNFDKWIKYDNSEDDDKPLPVKNKNAIDHSIKVPNQKMDRWMEKKDKEINSDKAPAKPKEIIQEKATKKKSRIKPTINNCAMDKYMKSTKAKTNDNWKPDYDI